MTKAVRWGVCATIKAPCVEVLRFAAHHLELGAHRVWVYLDVANEEARAALAAHPKCRVVTCDAAYWKRVFGRRPVKHQVRQSMNATRAYARTGDVDWLLHADVDEFLTADAPISDLLTMVPDAAMTVRVRPMEALAKQNPFSGETGFKAFIPAGPDRLRIVQELYPTFGAFLKGGFLSHVAGKVFVRTGVSDMTLRIHNAFHGETMNPDEVELDTMSLGHFHAAEWQNWHEKFQYRYENGAYRADLAPTKPRDAGGVTLHEFFNDLQKDNPSNGLRNFYKEVCADTPELRNRLATHNLLVVRDLHLDAALHHHFPTDIAARTSI